MSRLPKFILFTVARQFGAHLLSFSFIIIILGLSGISFAEGTKQLEPNGAPSNSVCKLVLSQNSIEYRIPFALVNCKEDFRLNIRISDFINEKIYLGFGQMINYADDAIIYTDVKYQIRDPKGNVVAGYSLSQLPRNSGNPGFITTRSQVDAGPNIDNLNTQGYTPLVINPGMNGDYSIEFEIPVPAAGTPTSSEMRVLKYFDATVANGNHPIPGRLWSKAWQLATRAVDADLKASFSLFYIYTNDSIVTRFDCNGLAGGVWSIYSNEWGSSTTGIWNDRRQSLRGNASVKPQYKIFLNDPDIALFPTGHIGEMVSFDVLPNVCDTVVTFEANVTKGGNINVQLDVDPPNPGSIGPEDVLLGYTVIAGYNVLLPAWNGKDGNGIPLANGTEVKAKISFLNGLSNVPLYDVEDNPRGFKVDIQRPMSVSGSSKLKIFWDDSKLSPLYFPTSNVTEGCIYSGIEPFSGCHSWTTTQNLGDTNTINSWWYLTTDQLIEKTVKLILRPSSGQITTPVTVCRGQTISFNSKSIDFAQKYHWHLSVPGFSADIVNDAPDSTFIYDLNESIPAGEYLVSVFGRNLVCGDGKIVTKSLIIHNWPKAAFSYDKACQGVRITFTDQSIPADALLNEFAWSVNSVSGNEPTFKGNPAVMVFDTAGNYPISHIVTDLLGCSDTVSSIITIKPKPDCAFIIIENTEINNGEIHFDNQTTGASDYSWDFGNNSTSNLPEPVVTYILEGNYTIMLVATSPEGCNDTITKQYYYMPGLWLPNAFSPDKNGQNDFFRPVTQRNTLEPYQLLIYDRWGQLVFKSTDPSEGWDGTFKGEPCQAGSYSYLLQYREAKIESSGIVTLRGMVSLIR
ncbi:MAG: gliding motility-associated C-terminal domain-containing protein [Bacteroidales bacterium]|nr:gliding motility-associated C-terminal domain-containing protein [Bacteroidales bacterium]